MYGAYNIKVYNIYRLYINIKQTNDNYFFMIKLFILKMIFIDLWDTTLLLCIHFEFFVRDILSVIIGNLKYLRQII